MYHILYLLIHLHSIFNSIQFNSISLLPDTKRTFLPKTSMFMYLIQLPVYIQNKFMNCSKPTDNMTLFTACSLRLDTNVNRLLLTTCCIHCITMFIVLQPTAYYFTQIQKKFVNSSWLPYTHTQLIMNSIQLAPYNLVQNDL